MPVTALMIEDEMREQAAKAMSGLTDAEWERRQIETTNHYYGGDPSGPDRVSCTLGKNHWRRQASLALHIALPWAREQALREAAKRAAEFTEPRILAMWSRPGGPPGNGWVPLTGKHVADAILALIPARPSQTTVLTAKLHGTVRND